MYNTFIYIQQCNEKWNATQGWVPIIGTSPCFFWFRVPFQGHMLCCFGRCMPLHKSTIMTVATVIECMNYPLLSKSGIETVQFLHDWPCWKIAVFHYIPLLVWITKAQFFFQPEGTDYTYTFLATTLQLCPLGVPDWCRHVHAEHVVFCLRHRKSGSANVPNFIFHVSNAIDWVQILPADKSWQIHLLLPTARSVFHTFWCRTGSNYAFWLLKRSDMNS